MEYTDVTTPLQKKKKKSSTIKKKKVYSFFSLELQKTSIYQITVMQYHVFSIEYFLIWPLGDQGI